MSIEAAAKLLAERMNYPWDQLPEHSKENLRSIARSLADAMGVHDARKSFKRPSKWTLLLTGDNNGIIGNYGCAFAGYPLYYERVHVYTAPPAANVPDEWVEALHDCAYSMPCYTERQERVRDRAMKLLARNQVKQ